MDAFQNARRNEEPEDFAERMNHEIRIESDHENHESGASPEKEDKMAARDGRRDTSQQKRRMKWYLKEKKDRMV